MTVIARASRALPALVLVVGVLAGGCSSRAPESGSASGAGTPWFGRSTPAPGPASGLPTLPEPAHAGADRRLAMAAAAHAIRRFPVPPGSRRVGVDALPGRFLRRPRVDEEPLDATLTRTRWWLVPLRFDRLVAWYVAHTPARIGTTLTPGATRPSFRAEVDWSTGGAATAYSPPAEAVAYERVGPHLTAIRTDVTLAARDDRTARTLAPLSVTSLRITKQAIDGPDTAPRTVTDTDGSDIRAVVTAFDRVGGWFAGHLHLACGSPVGIEYVYAVTFSWPGHSLDVGTGQSLCGIGRTLTRDGVVLPQRLDEGTDLDPTLDAAFTASS